MELALRSPAPDDTVAIGAALAPSLEARDVVVLTGDLGAGKTTLTRGVAEGLGATEHVQSPTFTLVREYVSGRLPVAHVDVFRLQRVQDVLDLALDEVEGGAEGVVLVEWGDAVDEALPGEHLRVALTTEPASEVRTITVAAGGESWERRWDALRERLDVWVART